MGGESGQKTEAILPDRFHQAKYYLVLDARIHCLVCEVVAGLVRPAKRSSRLRLRSNAPSRTYVESAIEFPAFELIHLAVQRTDTQFR